MSKDKKSMEKPASKSVEKREAAQSDRAKEIISASTRKDMPASKDNKKSK